jgi:hypothetical protein
MHATSVVEPGSIPLKTNGTLLAHSPKTMRSASKEVLFDPRITMKGTFADTFRISTNGLKGGTSSG